MEQAVVFASTQADSETIADSLRADGYDATALHGAMPQAVRNRRLQSLRKGQTRILVATDVAARGIDVPTITHVINFGLPMKAEDYVHRIGRTGRAGRSGVAITLAEHRDRSKIRAIEQYTQQQLQAEVIPGLEPSEKSRKPTSRPGSGGRPGRSFGGKGASNSSNRQGQGQGHGRGTSGVHYGGQQGPAQHHIAQARDELQGRQTQQALSCAYQARLLTQTPSQPDQHTQHQPSGRSVHKVNG
jgi:superfamily II DNA/RNA helicase